MKKTVLVLILLLTVGSSFAVLGQQMDWMRKIEGGASGCPGKMANDASGNLYVAGGFIGTLGFENGDTLHSVDNSDVSIFLAKFDSNGHTLMAVMLPMTNSALGDSRWLTITKVRVNPWNGRIAVLGNLNYDGDGYGYLAILRADGSLVGYSDAANGDWNTDAAFDSLGNTYLCGYTTNTVQSSYVSKFDSSGITLWSYISTEMNQAYSIAVKNGSVYIAGDFQDQMHVPDTTGATPVTLNASSISSWNLFEIKYSLAGHLLAGYATTAALPTTVPPTPPLSTDFSPSGTLNVGWQASSSTVQIEKYALNFSSSSPVLTMAASCTDPAGVVTANTFTESTMYSSVVNGCTAVNVAEYSASGFTGIDAIPTTATPYWLSEVDILGFSIDRNNSKYLMGSFTGTLNYTTSAGSSSLTSGSGIYDVYIGKYRRSTPTTTEESTVPSIDDIAVYPNPASSEITIAGLPDHTAITLSDVSGKTLRHIFSAGKKTMLNISTLPAGIYLLKTPVGMKKVVKI